MLLGALVAHESARHAVKVVTPEMHRDRLPNFITRPVGTPEAVDVPRPIIDRFHEKEEFEGPEGRMSRLRRCAFTLSGTLAPKQPSEKSDRAVWREVVDGR